MMIFGRPTVIQYAFLVCNRFCYVFVYYDESEKKNVF